MTQTPSDERIREIAPHVRAAMVPYIRELVEIFDKTRRLSFFQKLMIAKSEAFDKQCDDMIARMDAAIVGTLTGLLDARAIAALPSGEQDAQKLHQAGDYIEIAEAEQRGFERGVAHTASGRGQPSPELLPCPFCGGEAVRRSDGLPMIYCDGEECFGPATTARTWQDATVQWNGRASPQPSPAGETRELIVARGPTISLESCPIGLFVSSDGELCVKTEYSDNTSNGRIISYIVASGEFFWGGAKTPKEQRQVQVRYVVTPPASLQATGAEGGE